MIDLTGQLENGMWGYFELPGLENIVRLSEQKPRALIEGKALEARSRAIEKDDALIVDTV